MRIEKTALLYPAPLGMPLTPLTPPPSTGGPQAMDGDIHPAVDPRLERSFQDCARLYMARGDFSGCMAVIHGLELGLYVRRARCFTLYGAHAPQIAVHPLALGEPVRLSQTVPPALPHRCTALLLTVTTAPDTPPGKYRTNLEIEGEAAVSYLPVVIDVADTLLQPVETSAPAADADPLSILFSAAEEGPLPFREGEDYAGLLYRAARHDRMLYQAARRVDPLLTDTLLAGLRAAQPRGEDDAALLHKVRRTLVYRLDSRFDAGNREPIMNQGGNAG